MSAIFALACFCVAAGAAGLLRKSNEADRFTRWMVYAVIALFVLMGLAQGGAI